MKIRTGFVSNSSSSSFLIATKDGRIKKHLKVALANSEEHYALATIASAITKVIIEKSGTLIEDIEQLAEYAQEENGIYGHKDLEEMFKEEIDLLDKGYLLSFGWVSDQGDGATDEIEIMLTGRPMRITTDDFIFENGRDY